MRRKAIVLLVMMTMMVSIFAGCSEDKASSGTEDKTTPTAAADTTQTGTAGDATSSAETSRFKEAPSLKALVDSGELPPVEERLPVPEDVMVERKESIGKYGGSFNFTFEGKGSQWFYGKITEEPLFRFKTDGTVEPNVAKGYDVNEDATVFTIYLRKGMKWSDGEDFTADDVIFFYNEMCVKETFGKSLWDCFKVTDPEGNSSIAEFQKVDDYTFKVIFQYSKPTFLENLAINGKWCFAPEHWHKEILPHIIGEEEADKKAKEMGYADAASMGKETGYYYWNVPGRPTLRPWVVFENVDHNDCDGEYFVMRRNPYFWKVDEEGKQLPYVNELCFTKIAEAQQGLLKVMDGSVDISSVGYADYDVLVTNMERGGYELIEWPGVSWADMISQLHLNLTVKDEKKRALFNNPDFRQALSIAVDRDEYSEIMSDGFARGRQAAPSEGAMGYSKEWANKWTEYNPEKAKQLLESCGLVMGSDGYYDFADGTDFVLNLQTFTAAEADNSAELLMAYYDKVGIKTTYKPVDRSVLDNMTTSNDHEAIIAPVTPASTVSIILRPDTIVPVRNYAAWYGAFGNWYASGGKEGIEPTGDLKKLCDLYDQLKLATTSSERERIALEMLKLHEENIWVIGYMENLPLLIAKDKKIRNFPESAIFCDEFRDYGIAHLHCCYFEE
ncbi:MAG: ABC transporter substrate-binding protein [Bacillota bacterium]|jgi:peptide/nickel transport system substrate-binding protein|nr:ABC transporter substrate-binding protein [Bacillota bacterium]